MLLNVFQVASGPVNATEHDTPEPYLIIIIIMTIIAEKAFYQSCII